MSTKKKLFEEESSDDENEKCSTLNVNTSYAKNYDTWRGKEEYQKSKDRYGDVTVDSSDESSTDDDLAGTECPEFDMDLFRVIAALKLKHPIINENRQFFKDKYQFKPEVNISEEEKPMTLKDYERKIITEKGGAYDDEDEQSTSYEEPNHEVERKKLKKCVGFEDDNLSDPDEEEKDAMSSGIFVPKEKTDNDFITKEERKSRNEALSFLKGEKKSLGNKLDEELLGGLKKEWESKMGKEDKFLMDYFVNQRYLDDEDETVDRAPNHFALDIEPLSDDEKTYSTMEEYESKYRFRYEEPDEEFIKRHPRIIEDSMRMKDEKRKEERKKRNTRLEEAEERRKQEISRMKAYKKKEILEKIENLKEIAGRQDLNFEKIDLDADFDPDKHDQIMGEMFDDDYYDDGEDERAKPGIEDEELRRELEDQYAKLEQLDSMSEGTYRYEKVIPNSFGLSTEEILAAKDAELNRWYSLKKIMSHERSRELEMRELKNYEMRASNLEVVKRVLPSLFTDNIEESLEVEDEKKRRRNLKKKDRKLRKQGELAKLQTANLVNNVENELNQATKTKKLKKKLKNIDKIKNKGKDNAGETENFEIENPSPENVAEETSSYQAAEPAKKKKKRKLLTEGEPFQKGLEREETKESSENCKKSNKFKRPIVDESRDENMEDPGEDQQGRRRKHKKIKLDKTIEINIEDQLEKSKKKQKLKLDKNFDENMEGKGDDQQENSTKHKKLKTENNIRGQRKENLKKKNKCQQEVTEVNNLESKFIETQTLNENIKVSKLNAKKNKNTTTILNTNQDNIVCETFKNSKPQKQSSMLLLNKKKGKIVLPAKNENELEITRLSDSRLLAYGANPKKLRKKLKYSNKS